MHLTRGRETKKEQTTYVSFYLDTLEVLNCKCINTLNINTYFKNKMLSLGWVKKLKAKD